MIVDKLDIRDSDSFYSKFYFKNLLYLKKPHRLNKLYKGKIYSINDKASYFNLSFIELPWNKKNN